MARSISVTPSLRQGAECGLGGGVGLTSLYGVSRTADLDSWTNVYIIALSSFISFHVNVFMLCTRYLMLLRNIYVSL